MKNILMKIALVSVTFASSAQAGTYCKLLQGRGYPTGMEIFIEKGKVIEKNSFETKTEMKIEWYGPRLFEKFDTVFVETHMSTRCDVYDWGRANLGTRAKIEFKKITYKGSCGIKSDPAVFTVNPGMPNQIAYKMDCNSEVLENL